MSELKKNIKQWIETGQLIRLNTVHNKTGNSFLHGRILQYNQEDQRLLFYHDDEKKVYNLSLNEIENMEPAKTPKRNAAADKAGASSDKPEVGLPHTSKSLNELAQLLEHLPEEALKALIPIARHLKNESKK